MTVNKLLAMDPESRRRDLTMRTYNVVPLAQDVGVIEFVGNTMALSSHLNKLHERYGKLRGDWDKSKCQQLLKTEKEKGLKQGEKSDMLGL